MTASQPRFYVLDRQGAQATSLTRWSIVNPRYFVMDRTTGKDVDACTTKRSAQGAASLYNSQESQS